MGPKKVLRFVMQKCVYCLKVVCKECACGWLLLKVAFFPQKVVFLWPFLADIASSFAGARDTAFPVLETKVLKRGSIRFHIS